MAEKQTLAIGKGQPGPGRPKGIANRTTTLLKEAIIRAAQLTGSDGKGKDGLIGYCRHLALHEQKAFAMLMGRVLPLQIAGEDGGKVGVTFTTIYQAKPEPRLIEASPAAIKLNGESHS